MLLIAASITCATFNLVFLGILLCIAVAGLVILSVGPRFLKQSVQDGVVLVTLAESEYRTKSAEILGYLETALRKGQCDSIVTTDEQISISYSFRNLQRTTVLQLQSELTAIADSVAVNIYFHHAGL